MYSQDAKNVLLAKILKEGKSINEVSNSHKVSKSTLHRWLKELPNLKQKEVTIKSPCCLSMNNSKTVLEAELEIEVKKLKKEVESLIHTVSIYARINEKELRQEIKN